MRKFFLLFLLIILTLSSCVKEKSSPSPLEGVAVADVTLASYETKKVIDAPSAFGNVLYRAIDMKTNVAANWLTVKLEKGKITLTLEENTTINDRTAQVTLYMGSNRENVDNADLEVSFLVTQKKNEQFDDLELEEVIMSSMAKDSTIVLKKTIQNAKVEVQSVDGFDDEVSWCQVRLNNNKELKIRVSENRSVGERQALVTLLPSKGEDDTETASVAFLVSQAQNTVFDNLELKNLEFTYDGPNQVVRTDRQLKDIRALVIDGETAAKATWCSVTVAGDSLTVKAQTLNVMKDRSAQVTLYLPNNGETIDSTTLVKTFQVVQHHNTVFEGTEIPDTTLKHDQLRTVLKLKLKTPMKNIKPQVIDEATEANVKWLTIKADADSVVLSAQTFKDAGSRSALVTLYYPNDKGVGDEATVKTTFRVTQRQNDVFDNFKATDIHLPSDATTKELIFDSELTDIACVMTDSATKASPKWLTAKIEGKKVVFTAQANADLGARKAAVTLYYKNGSTIGDNTVKTTFNIRQAMKEQILLDETKYVVAYNQKTLEIPITSNVGYKITGQAMTEGRISWSGTQLEGTKWKLIISFNKENETEVAITDVLHIASTTNSNLQVDLTIVQKTNPLITLSPNTNQNFRKGGGSFQLMVNTLTPDYKIVKEASWITIGNKIHDGLGKFHHEITIQRYDGAGPLRKDTLFIKNDEVTQKLVITEDKYIYLSATEIKLEVGQEYDLNCTNHTNNPLSWRSDNRNVATVNSSGRVTALQSGQTRIYASIGSYVGVQDYNDYCTVKVFTVTDSVSIVRGSGEYKKDNGFVDALCPVTITNGYHGAITLQSVEIVGDDNSTHISATTPTPQTISGMVVKSGESKSVNFSQLTNVLNPKVVLKFSCNGKDYTKEVTY